MTPTFLAWYLLNDSDRKRHPVIRRQEASNKLQRRDEMLDKVRNLDLDSLGRWIKLLGRYYIEWKGHKRTDERILLDAIQLLRNSSLVDNEYDAKDAELKDKGVKVMKDHYVVMKANKGQLGNWLFQYAFMFSVAKKLNYKYIISPTHRMVPFFDLPNVSNMSLKNLIRVQQPEWDNQTWHENTDYLSHNLTFCGYYQRSSYFINNSKEIKETIKVKAQYLKVAREIIDTNTPKEKTLIGIHVRRGDFLDQRDIHKGSVVADRDYFIKAMSYFRQLHPDVIFIVVSNDQQWCHQNIVGADVRYSPAEEAIIDFAIMTLCDHTIITAGTFGWWAGWLAGGTVVYLADYPRPRSYMERKVMIRRENYYPPDWIPIANGNRTY